MIRSGRLYPVRPGPASHLTAGAFVPRRTPPKSPGPRAARETKERGNTTMARLPLSVFIIGASTSIALVMGGNIRVGLEDSIRISRGKLAP
jgi:hypothetical protein